jgi:hypothetical protein
LNLATGERLVTPGTYFRVSSSGNFISAIIGDQLVVSENKLKPTSHDISLSQFLGSTYYTHAVDNQGRAVLYGNVNGGAWFFSEPATSTPSFISAMSQLADFKPEEIASVKFSEDSNYLIIVYIPTSKAAARIMVRSTHTGQVVIDVSAETDFPTQASLSISGNLLFALDKIADGTEVKVWRTSDGKEVTRIVSTLANPIMSTCPGADDNTFYVGFKDHHIEIRDPQLSEPLASIQTQRVPNVLHFDSSTKILSSLSIDKWNVERWRAP